MAAAEERPPSGPAPLHSISPVAPLASSEPSWFITRLAPRTLVVTRAPPPPYLQIFEESMETPFPQPNGPQPLKQPAPAEKKREAPPGKGKRDGVFWSWHSGSGGGAWA